MSRSDSSGPGRWLSLLLLVAGGMASPERVGAQDKLPPGLAILRLETVSAGLPLAGPPKASFTLESFDGSTRVKLATDEMFFGNAADGAPAQPCTGITNELCVGDFAVAGLDDPRFGSSFSVSVTEGPAGTVPAFSGNCDRLGGVALVPQAVMTCRVTFVNADTGKNGNAAVLVTKQWDTSRPAGALPEGTLGLFAQQDGGLSAEIKLSALRNGNEWLAGITLDGGAFAELREKIDAAGWVGFVSGDCNTDEINDRLAIGKLLKCVVTNFALEASVPAPDAVLRIEAVQVGPALKPQGATFKVESDDGAQSVSLSSNLMYGPDLLADGRQSSCAGISSAMCSGDIGLQQRNPSDPRDVYLGGYTVSVTDVPGGTFPVFSGGCTAGGGFTMPPQGIAKCRVTFVNADTATAGANGAVHVVKAWDISRPAGPLPDGTLTLALAGEDVIVTRSLSSLRDGTEWLAGMTLAGNTRRLVELTETIDTPGWLTTTRGACNSDELNDRLGAGGLVSCEVSNIYPEVSAEGEPVEGRTGYAAVRVETMLLGAAVKTPAAATFRLRSLDGKVDLLLDSSKMYRLHPASGEPELCSGISSEICIGDFGVLGEVAGPHSFANYELSVVNRPPGTVAIVVSGCPANGLLQIEPGSFPTCRIDFLPVDTGGADADAAVHITKIWDTNRPAGPLPDGLLLLDAEPNGGRTAEMPLSKLRNGSEWVAGVSLRDKFASVTLSEKLEVPGWIPLIGGDCNNVTDPTAVLRPGSVFTCSVLNLSIEAYPKPAASIAGAAVVEGNTGTRQVLLTISLDAAPLLPVRMAYATANGSAIAPADYVAKSGTVTIPAGQTTATVTVTVNGEILGEANETFRLILSALEGATSGASEAIVTIVNDDDATPPAIAAKSNVIVETRAAPIAVLYTAPTATDLLDGKAVVDCTPKSGALLPFGTTGVKCTAQDLNGNIGSSGFSIIVRTPTTTGAVTNPGNSTALTTVGAGRRVRVSAGGFAPGSAVALSWIGPSGEVTHVDGVVAGADGRIDTLVKVPSTAALGPSQMTAVGIDAAAAEFVRAWKLTVTPE